MLNNSNLKLLTLYKLRGVGPATIRKIISLPDFHQLSVSELASIDRKLDKAIAVSGAWDAALRLVDADIEAADKYGAKIISFLDHEYPALLRATPDCPPFLYVRGCLYQSPEKSVAVIGTRNPTEHGKLIADRITDFLVSERWSIVSGLALGCDALAHESAIAHGGHTVAVMAHGLQTVAPKQHENLANRILDAGGALVTEYAFGEEPIPPYFVKRDRIQAGLSQGVVMIQSDREGGSLHASRAAIEYQRLLAVPKPTDKDIFNKEKKIDANAVLCGEDVDDKIALLKCSKADLSNLFIIKSRDDYRMLCDTLERNAYKSPGPPPYS